MMEGELMSLREKRQLFSLFREKQIYNGVIC